MSDDMSFCMDECERIGCERHPSNIVERSIPHSYMHFKGTEFCQRMTREEAIAYGREQLEVFGGLHREFIELAIEALERKHGEWETRWSTYFHADLEYCSVCHNGSALRYKYCPNCGADMRGEKDGV